MKLDVASSIGFEAPWPIPVVLILSPRSGDAQHVISEQLLVDPFVPWHEYVDGHGNRCHRLTVPTGRTTVTVRATVDTPDAIDVDPTAPRSEGDGIPDWVLEFCLPSRYCPSDLLREPADGIVAGVLPGYPQVEAIRSWIERNVRYEYNTSSASTSAMDTLRVRTGVCRDFAHLGIALCRAIDIPARMVVGYLHDLHPMDQHAWFEAFVGGRWYTFDATQPAPRGNRVATAYGRDAADVAFVTQFGPVELTDMWVMVSAAV
jgi:transglutaminase-like putative cysteine protease